MRQRRVEDGPVFVVGDGGGNELVGGTGAPDVAHALREEGLEFLGVLLPGLVLPDHLRGVDVTLDDPFGVSQGPGINRLRFDDLHRRDLQPSRDGQFVATVGHQLRDAATPGHDADGG